MSVLYGPQWSDLTQDEDDNSIIFPTNVDELNRDNYGRGQDGGLGPRNGARIVVLVKSPNSWVSGVAVSE